jgi:hypothetical protein
MKLLPCPGKHPERLLSHEELRRWRRNGQAAAWCEVQLGHETLSVGKSANSAEDCTLELCGRWLAYRIALSRSVGLMDSGDEPEMYLGVGDGIASHARHGFEPRPHRYAKRCGRGATLYQSEPILQIASPNPSSRLRASSSENHAPLSESPREVRRSNSCAF